jgi:predicted permease
VRQLVTESLVLALGGGLLGIALATASLPLMAQLVPAELPYAGAPAMDLRVLGAALAATFFAALVFGVVPSLRACRDVDADGLREGARGAIGGRRARLVRAVVVAEVSISLVLLVCSGLLLRALWQLQARDPGFRPAGVLTLRTWLPWPRYERTADRTRFYDRVLAETRALPGVSGAAYISFLPMAMGGGIWRTSIPGRPDDTEERRAVSLRFVTPQLFSALQVPLRAGRDVSDDDGPDRPLVAVVSESFARRHWPGDSALGKRFDVAFAERTIVGVVGDIRVRGLEHDSEPQVYLPSRQQADGSLVYYTPKDLVVRSSLPAQLLVPSLRAIVRSADPAQPISNVRPLDDVVAAQTAPRRMQLAVLVGFAALAFLLAALGIYGLLSFAVSTRAREIGVRMALGATPASVLGMVVREGCVLGAAGAALGLALAWAAGRSLEALLAGVAPSDAATCGAAVVLVFVMTLAGSVVPAWRAARVDPAVVLRAE